MQDQTPSGSQDARKWPASPVSISEAARLAGQRGGIKKRRRYSGGASHATGSIQMNPSSSQSRLQICQTSTPITPSVDTSHTNHDINTRVKRDTGSIEKHVQSHLSGYGLDDNSDVPQTLSPKPSGSRGVSFLEDHHGHHGDHVEADPGDEMSWLHTDTATAITPPRMGGGLGINSTPFAVTEGTARPRPSILQTTAAHDMSLPSPSLSPVTAAANLQSRMGYFEEPGLGDMNINASFESLHSETLEDADSKCSGTILPNTPDGASPRLSMQRPTDVDFIDEPVQAPSIMDIPSMLDSFEAMPAEMKTYVMYQFLRRCPKPVLHFVANVVDPALKCDFLSLLPLELCLNVVGFLDMKSLCSAAQVSKKWRRVINSDEKAWKHLFDSDGYVLPEGELQRAIREGWGWQHTSRLDDWEKDLFVIGATTPEMEWSQSARRGISGNSATGTPDGEKPIAQNRRTKRKAVSKTKSASRKQQKKKEANLSNAAQLKSDDWMKNASAAEGPYAAANAAAIAIPYPQVGLASLKNLHLFKSIYQRHHLIRKSWMQDEIKPRHIAFRAHQRHVVTCLQFDTDKILTGSDDTNINVYDTQTGALRSRLEGHEGGVWALQYEGNMLVSGSTDRSVRVWDIEKGVCTQVFQGHTSTVRCLQILLPTPVDKTADGRVIMMPKQPLIITGSRDSNLRVWKLPKPEDKTFFATGTPQDDTDCPYFIRVLTGHHHSVRAIAAHADTLVSGSYDCSVRVWKISTGETLHRLQGHAQKVYSVVLDHQRNRCISGSMDNLVKVWSLDTGSVLYNLEGHTSLVGLLDLQQDRLVSAAADSTLRVWDPETGHCKSTLSAHTGAITCFQHDGQKVISGSDRTLKMWNVKNGEFIKDLLTDLSGVWQVKFNERRCVAAVQRNNLTYIEVSVLLLLEGPMLMIVSQVLDFGASRDGVPEHKRGRRIVVNATGEEVTDPFDNTADLDATTED